MAAMGHAADRGTGQSTVLLVDDHSAIREGLKSFLRDTAEFTVVGEAADAVHTLALVQSLKPAIVVLDLSIPGRGGIAVAEDIRKLSAETRIVVYTMHAETGFLAAMERAGASGYVLKGEPLSELLEAMRAARDGRSRIPDASSLDGRSLFGEPGKEATEKLSHREKEIFLMLAEGRSVKQAAFDLGLSPKTVETYKYRLMRKLEIETVVDLAKLAIRVNLVRP